MKALALLLRLNWMTAVAFSVITQMLVSKLELAGMVEIPNHLMGYLIGGGGSMHPQRYCLQFVMACCVLLVVLLLVPQIPGLSRSRCFLDLCCLHPTDPLRQLKTQRQLGGVLQSSRRMIVLWEADYFTKLQCVVEISAFVATRKGNSSVNSSLLFVPLKNPTLLLGLYIYHFVASTIFVVITPLSVQSKSHAFWIMKSIPEGARGLYFWVVYSGMLFFGVYALQAFPLWMFCRAHLSDQRLLLKQLREFSVENSECFLESERQQLLQSITSGFGSIAKFEQYVREELPKMVVRGGLPIRIALFGGLSHIFLFWNQAVLAYKDGERELSVIWLVGLAGVLCADAISLSFFMKLADTAWADNASHGSTLMKAVGPLLSAGFMSVLCAIVAANINPIAGPAAHAVSTFLFLAVTLWLLRNDLRDQRDRAGIPRSNSRLTSEHSMRPRSNSRLSSEHSMAHEDTDTISIYEASI